MYYTILTVLTICLMAALSFVVIAKVRQKPTADFPYCIKYGWSAYATGFFFLAIGIALLYILPTAGVNECRQDDERWIVALMSGFMGASGLIVILSALSYRIQWNDATISYRSFWGRKCTAHFEDITGFDLNTWFGFSCILFENAPKLYVMEQGGDLRNAEAFNNKISEILKAKKPHYFYEPAFREDVEQSSECGCLACLSVFPANAISNWRLISQNEENDEDLAICPACGHEETVLCDMGEVSITGAELRIINRDIDNKLNEKERRARQIEHETAQNKLNTKTLPPEFSV